MIIGKVIGNVWATRKDEKLNGLKFLVIEPSKAAAGEGSGIFVAADIVGAGIGDSVLVTKGSAASASLHIKDVPVDAVIVGIIDSLEVDAEFL
ncbi:EutN/CcmL family microcompartment protein [Clostridium sp. CM028]|uniref:EutN/CcmL family microcompartment protein n=1 Tax=Clostridium TaxID=1485 RepID=UPI0013EEAFA7|nr:MULTISPECIES: EutN/CcmL family microcompartment protein [Clostridium]MBU3092669.1 EutN/CcmL family microcompartment protein [Clostridium sp. CF011]MBW9148897.1 EutN/CcmL family microcompartment protein [Clostridium sp. CM028]MBZ9606966.1 EutN/CcmL family microcompartment protein [Clostridium estertheticum]WAG71450.1 EutN/CcmL family microcompartment protein [Clostridium sp. CF011]WLC63002.1 EutN/CcmL family microcompartment protein [Clostridium sp. CM028]